VKYREATIKQVRDEVREADTKLADSLKQNKLLKEHIHELEVL